MIGVILVVIIGALCTLIILIVIIYMRMKMRLRTKIDTGPKPPPSILRKNSAYGGDDEATTAPSAATESSRRPSLGMISTRRKSNAKAVIENRVSKRVSFSTELVSKVIPPPPPVFGVDIFDGGTANVNTETLAMLSGDGAGDSLAALIAAQQAGGNAPAPAPSPAAADEEEEPPSTAVAFSSPRTLAARTPLPESPAISPLPSPNLVVAPDGPPHIIVDEMPGIVEEGTTQQGGGNGTSVMAPSGAMVALNASAPLPKPNTASPGKDKDLRQNV